MTLDNTFDELEHVSNRHSIQRAVPDFILKNKILFRELHKALLSRNVSVKSVFTKYASKLSYVLGEEVGFMGIVSAYNDFIYYSRKGKFRTA